VLARGDCADDALGRLQRICGAVTEVAAHVSRREAWGVDFRVLGPVEVRAEGRPLALAGTRQRALLAVLLLNAGEPVSRDRVIADLWGERPPDGAVKTVQAVVSRLRRALGGEASRLVTSAAGYRLRVEPDELDLSRFERLCAEGRRALAAGRYERAAARMRAALDEWHGPPLADLALEPFAPPEVARLEDLRGAAVEDRIEADLAIGRGAELVGELEGLVAAEPLRERLRGQLMLALYRAGRQGEALDAYRDAVRTLDVELGLQPGPELERLQKAILAHDPALLRTAAREPSPEADRRRAMASILCVEPADFAAVRSRVGDAEADRVRGEYDGRARDVLASHGATAVHAVGDGLLAAFSSAGAAVACAVELQRAIARQARRGPVPVELRVGVGAGDVAWTGDGYSGTPVTDAQRLCSAAPAGRILITETVRLLAGSQTDARLEDAGELELSGLAQPLRAWSVIWTAQHAVAVPVPASLDVEPGHIFVGRERELAELRAAWDDAVRGRRRGVFVSGEPGIGKTRLAAEIARHAREREGVVLYGRCDDGLAPAAQPFAEALGAYAAACPVDELRVQLGGRGSDLIPLLPDLAERVPGLGEPAPAEPDIERLRMLEAAGALLEAAGAAVPVLLVLDDMHWGDELSLLLLRHLLRAEAAMRLLVLATYRDTEPSRWPHLVDIVAGLARRSDVARLELGPLAEPDIAAILAHVGRRPVLAAQIRTATEGNPFFVREMVDVLGDERTAGGPITPRVRDIVRWRVGRLPEPVADVLAVAAVIGTEFDADVLAGALDIELASALDVLEAAERARLVRPVGSLDRFTFAHALVRETIADELPAGRRVRMHARIAHALVDAAATRAVAAGDLAAHFDAAGTLVDAATTMRHSRAAGDEAAARFAFDVAAEQYERAVRAHARLPSGREHERLELELERGRALSLAGDQTAHAALRGVAAAAERAGDGRRMADALLTLRLDYADHIEEDAEMVALLRRALALLPHGDSAIRAHLEGFLAQEAFSTMPDSERRAAVRRALAMARRVGDQPALASVLTSHCWIVAGPESVPERLAIADELVAVGRVADLPYAECDGQQWRFLALVEIGEIEGADTALAAAHAAARTTKSKWTVGFLDAARALLAGRLADAEVAAARSREAAQETVAPSALNESAFVRLLTCIRLVQGRLSEHGPARRAMAQGLTNPPATFFIISAHAARERQDHDGAREAFDAARSRGLLDLPHGPTWTATLTWAADICAWLDDRSTATSLRELLEPYASVMTWQYGPVGRGIALLDLALGHRDQAERRLREAIALCERTDARAFLAMARHDLGALLRPSPEGRRLLDQARADADAMGMLSLGRAAARVQGPARPALE
jgi:DNA-binding SARP family transcriptional activator